MEQALPTGSSRRIVNPAADPPGCSFILHSVIESVPLHSVLAWLEFDKPVEAALMITAPVRGLVGRAMDESGRAFALMEGAKRASRAAPILFRPAMPGNGATGPARATPVSRVEFRITLLPSGADAVAIWADLAATLEKRVRGMPLGAQGSRVTGGGVRWETMVSGPQDWFCGKAQDGGSAMPGPAHQVTDSGLSRPCGEGTLLFATPMHLRHPRAPGDKTRGKHHRELVSPETLTLPLLAQAAVRRLREVAMQCPDSAAAREFLWDPWMSLAAEVPIHHRDLRHVRTERRGGTDRPDHRIDLSGITGSMRTGSHPRQLSALWRALSFLGIGEHCSEGCGAVEYLEREMI